MRKHKFTSIKDTVFSIAILSSICVLGIFMFVIIYYLTNFRQFTRSQANENHCQLQWNCMGEIASDSVKSVFGCKMYKWMKEKADNTHYQPPFENQTGWYCLDECANQSVITAFGGNKDLWLTQKSAAKGLTKNDCLKYVDDSQSDQQPPVQQQSKQKQQSQQQPLPQSKITPSFISKTSGRSFPCAYSVTTSYGGQGQAACYGGKPEIPHFESGFNNNCIWHPEVTEEVFCPGETQVSANPLPLAQSQSQILPPKQNPVGAEVTTPNTSVQSIAVIGDSLSAGQGTNAYHGILKNKLNLERVDVFASVGAGTSNYANASLGMTYQLENMLFTKGIKYDYVVVFGGVNDLYNGVNITTIKNNLQNIYSRLAAKGMKVITISVLPWKSYKFASYDITKEAATTKTYELNNWIANSAKDVFLYINAFNEFNDPQDYGALKSIYSQNTDGLHINYAGQAKLADLIYAKLVAN